MKKCELCNSVARMVCDSDQASLCWDCDARVHAANFLVAKHSRTLLCHSCQAPTPWTGSGSRLGPTLSVCHTCATRNSSASASASHSRRDPQESDDRNEDDDEDEDGEDDEDEDDDDDDDDEGENQVVPLSSSSMNRPLVSDSSTSSEGTSRRVFGGFEKSGIGYSWRSLH